ncbi:MAG TPA: hypothetical protein VGP22_17135 [Albitalea sp.]|nr:hypothetical protein [Albitalea sp.]
MVGLQPNSRIPKVTRACSVKIYGAADLLGAAKLSVSGRARFP